MSGVCGRLRSMNKTTINNVWQNYYSSLEGATIIRFNGMVADEFNPYGDGFPTFTVKFANGEIGIIEISQDPEGNGGGFIFGLPLSNQGK